MSQTCELLKETVHAEDYVQRRRALSELRRMGRAVIDDLIAALSDPDVEIARAALSILAELRGSRVEDVLIALVADEKSPLRGDAARMLAGFDDARAFEALSEALSSGFSGAAEVIGRLSDERAPGVLADALGSDNPDIRASALFGLGRLNDPVAVTHALNALQDPEPKVRFLAVLALGDLSDRGLAGSEIVGPLVAALSDSDWHVRSSAANALGSASDEDVAETLWNVVQGSDDDRVRMSAAYSLARMGDERAIEPSISFLKHPDYLVRIQAIDAVARLRPDGAANILAEMLQDENDDVRRTTVSALGFLRDSSAVEPLITALDDSSPIVVEFAVHSLEFLKAPRITDVMVRMLHHADPQVRWATAGVLSNTRDPRAAQVLMDALKAKNTPVICGAYTFYIRKAVPGCEQALIDCLDITTGRRMATDMSDCGNPVLEQAARKWLDEHLVGERMIDVMAGPSRKPRWGRER